MAPKKSAAAVELVYQGGMSGVVMHFPSEHVVEFIHGVPVSVCVEDAESLADNPDFQPAVSAKSTDSQEA